LAFSAPSSSSPRCSNGNSAPRSRMVKLPKSKCCSSSRKLWIRAFSWMVQGKSAFHPRPAPRRSVPWREALRAVCGCALTGPTAKSPVETYC
jgi:hypothetical protein